MKLHFGLTAAKVITLMNPFRYLMQLRLQKNTGKLFS